ncbi:MAG: hypothetical protein A2275_08665 [Bacteroidetes bacterium RIFOXYA12_FULL_35_11]|nr:MAG: hypothetical protein A2275_08665 [Bacteroidetes bacterium RIFOXYA12_FULL_35_11]
MGLATTINAQSNLTIDASQQYSSFKFTDASGTSLNTEYTGVFTGAYSLGYRYISEKGIMANGTIGMRKAGANLDYDAMNYTWDLQYFQSKLGIGYMYKKLRFSPYITVAGYFGYMLRGFQIVNNEDFNLLKTKSLNEIDYGIIATPGVQYKISDAISTYAEFSYLMGLQNLEKDEGQKSQNLAYGVTLGLCFSIKK